jgi:hypothetical protein
LRTDWFYAILFLPAIDDAPTLLQVDLNNALTVLQRKNFTPFECLRQTQTCTSVQSSIRFPKDSLSSPLVTTAKKEITTAKKPDEETLIGAQQSAKEVELLQKKFWRYCAVVDLFCANRIPCNKLNLDAHHGQVIIERQESV